MITTTWRCKSLRLIDGGSPGSQTPSDPATPSPRALTGVSARGLKKPDERSLPTAERLQNDGGLMEILSIFPRKKLLGGRSIYCAHFSIQEANDRNTARGASSPVKPGKNNMPLPGSTTSVTTSTPEEKSRTRIDLRSRVCPFT